MPKANPYKPASFCSSPYAASCYDPGVEVSLQSLDTRLSGVEARLLSIERLQYWTLGLIGGLVLAMLTGSLAIIASLLQ